MAKNYFICHIVDTINISTGARQRIVLKMGHSYFRGIDAHAANIATHQQRKTNPCSSTIPNPLLQLLQFPVSASNPIKAGNIQMIRRVWLTRRRGRTWV